jgi:hypothetical protein
VASGDFCQLCEGDTEGVGERIHGSPGGVGLAALQERDRAGGDAGILGQAFLREATPLAELADGLSKGGLRLVWASHGLEAVKDEQSSPGEVQLVKLH